MNATKSNSTDVTVITVTYNSAHCIKALANLYSHLENIIFVDNGSEDGTCKQINQLIPHAKLITIKNNIGFGAANNIALKQIRTNYAFLLNPDCELNLDQLKQLLDAADKFPTAAIIAPQLTDLRGQPEINYRWPSTYWTSKGPGAKGPVCVGFVCGAAMLLRISEFMKTGYFDERFFLYYEDDDLCFRLFQARLPMIIVPDIQVLHRSRGSVKGKSPWRSEYWRGYHHVQSKLIYAAKHVSPQAAMHLRKKLLWQTVLILPIRIFLFSPKLIARMWGRLRGVIRWTLLKGHS